MSYYNLSYNKHSFLVTPAQLRMLLAEVFSNQFSQPETAQSFLKIAAKIKADIQS